MNSSFNMAFIRYDSNFLQVGGLGHSFCDWVSTLIISKLLNIAFLHNKLQTSIQKRDFDMDNNPDPYFWNNFLNLDFFENPVVIPNTIIKYISPVNPFQSIPITILNDLDISVLEIYCLKNNNRIYLFDLYNYELQGIVRNGITKDIIDSLRKAFYLKHPSCNLQSDKKIVNVYIRRGDLYNLLKKNIDPSYFDFEFDILNYIYNYNTNYIFNIISAGSIQEINDLKIQFKNFNNINFIFNEPEEYVFKLMVNSDILIYTCSSFPFTASLYCNGLIIKKKTDYYLSDLLFYKDIKFFENYIFIDSVEELEKFKSRL